jgi:hypothetical protein
MILKDFNLKFNNKDGRIHFVPIGDIHFGSSDHEGNRFQRFINWVKYRETKGEQTYLLGMGDYIEMPSPSERASLRSAKGGYGLHETTLEDLDSFYLDKCDKFLEIVKPINKCFLGTLIGHHWYTFSPLSKYAGKSTDEYLSERLGCVFFGQIAYLSLRFPQVKNQTPIIVLAHHGMGSSRSDGAKLMKRERMMKIAHANIYLMGHDDSKFIFSNKIFNTTGKTLVEDKVFYCGTGSFQRGYTPGIVYGGYAEQMLFSPHDTGVVAVDFEIDKVDGKEVIHWRGSV